MNKKEVIMNKKEKTAGLIAGVSLIIMAIAAGFSYGFVQTQLVSESVEITRQNIIDNKSMFLAGIAGWIVIFSTDLIVSGALYIFFKTTTKRIALLTASVRIIYTMVLGYAIYQLIGIIPLLQKAGSAFEVSAQFAAFNTIWSAGLIIFGFHLLGLGYLSKESHRFPKLLSYLVLFAGVCYVLVHGVKQFALLSPNAISSAESILALPMALGELLIAVWMIYIGLKRAQKIL